MGEDYYRLLGVERDADGETIRKAFRSLAKKHHPDKGGDPEKFKAISKAANVLQDPNLRSIYDKHGEQGLQDQQNHHHHHHHHYQNDMMFQRGEMHQVRLIGVGVSLEEAYVGLEKLSTFEWEKPCDECGMTGCKPGKSGKKCPECRGQGMIVRVIKLAPNMIQQSQTLCQTCRGQGIHIHDHDRCNKCQGSKKYLTNENVLIRVPKGTQNKQRLFPVVGNLRELFETHNIVFVAEQTNHTRYERRGKNGEHLVTKQTISLLEALTGATFCLPHLDGTQLQVTTPPDTVTKPGDIYRLPNQGMPIVNVNNQDKDVKDAKVEAHGDLFVAIEIQFPESNQITPAIQQILIRTLPQAPQEPSPPKSATSPVSMKLESTDKNEISQKLQPPQQQQYQFHQQFHQHQQQQQQQCRQM